MPLSAATKHELKDELESLVRRAEAIKQILASEPGSDVLPSVPSSGNGFRKLGLRDAIRTVLQGRSGLEPKTVTAELKSRGYAVEGKTSLATRVANEMGRMASAKELAREEGRYSIASTE